MTAFSQLTQRSSMQPWPQPLRRCLRRLGPLRPVPPSFALSAGIPCLCILRFLCLRHKRHSRTVSPGSESLLFDEEILGVVVSQVQQSSLISSNLAMSRLFARGRGRSSSSPLAAPASAGASRQGQQRRKRSSSSSRFNSRKRSRGGGESAASSGPSGFRK